MLSENYKPNSITESKQIDGRDILPALQSAKQSGYNHMDVNSIGSCCP